MRKILKQKMIFFRKRLFLNRGLSLVETLVALAIFAMSILVVLSTILAITKNERIARKTTNVVNGISFVLDDMSRTIKRGSLFHCGFAGPGLALENPVDCPAGQASMAVEKSSGSIGDATDQIVYRRVAPTGRGVIEKSIDGGVSFFPLTTPYIDIDYLLFRVMGSNGVGGRHPRVLVTVGANTYPDINNYAIALEFQTTFSESTTP